MLRRLILALPLLPGAPLSASAQEVLASEGMAGIGVQGCETVAGAENTPVLAAAVDWGLGYLAGRRDGGHRPVEGEPLSTTDPADLAVGIVLYCRENPYGLVLDALRSYGLRVFAEGPEADPAQQPRLPRVRAFPRPEAGPSAAQEGWIALTRVRLFEDRARRVGSAALAAAAGPGPAVRLIAATASTSGERPEEEPPAVAPTVSRRASDLAAGTIAPVPGPSGRAAPATSPRPPRRDP